MPLIFTILKSFKTEFLISFFCNKVKFGKITGIQSKTKSWNKIEFKMLWAQEGGYFYFFAAVARGTFDKVEKDEKPNSREDEAVILTQHNNLK